MVGGVVSDIYHAEERNTPMALFSAAALVGTGLAPLLAGAIVYHTTWRWIFYSHAIVLAAVVVVMYFFFDETRGSVILSRKAQKLNAYYDQLEAAGHHGVMVADERTGERLVKRLRWKVKSDEDRASLADMISQSCYRPFRRSPCLRDSRPLLTRGMYRYALHRAGRLLLLRLDLVQLGRAVLAIRLDPFGL